METVQQLITYLESVLTPEGQPDLDTLGYIQVLLREYREDAGQSAITENLRSLESWVKMLCLADHSRGTLTRIKAMILSECKCMRHTINDFLSVLKS